MTGKSVTPRFFTPGSFVENLENWISFGLGVHIGLGSRDDDLDDQPWGIEEQIDCVEAVSDCLDRLSARGCRVWVVD